MSELAIAPLSSQVVSATEQVFDALYKAVISLDLPPGTKVSEVEIARQLGVSRQPVRDAFFRLSKLGFLAIRPQRATLITRISERAVMDAVFTRTALEVECLREAIAQFGTVDETELRASLARQDEALKDDDPAAFHDLDDAFHAKICEIAGQSHAWAIVQEHKAHMDRIRFLTLSGERPQRVVHEHTAIVDAMVARNVYDAEIGLRTHLRGVASIIGDIRARFPDYFEPTK